MPDFSSVGICVIAAKNICRFERWIAGLLIGKIFIAKLIYSEWCSFNAACRCLFGLPDFLVQGYLVDKSPEKVRNSPEYTELKIKTLSFLCRSDLDLTKRFYECKKNPKSEIRNIQMTAKRWIYWLEQDDLDSIWLRIPDQDFISLHKIEFQHKCWLRQNSKCSFSWNSSVKVRNWLQALMAEWLRRVIRNHLGSSRAGSNPVQCDLFLQISRSKSQTKSEPFRSSDLSQISIFTVKWRQAVK